MKKNRTKFDELMEAAEVEIWKFGIFEHGGVISTLAKDFGLDYAKVRNRLKVLELLDYAKEARSAARDPD
jgi:hypothetical protein